MLMRIELAGPMLMSITYISHLSADPMLMKISFPLGVGRLHVNDYPIFMANTGRPFVNENLFFC